MGSDSQRRRLGDYFVLQRGTTYKSRLLGQPGPVLLGLATIHRNGGFRSDSLKTYGGESPAKLLVKPGELYVSLKDVTQAADLLGAVARLPTDHAPGRLTQDTVKLEPKNGGNVPLDYLYWLLRTPQYRTYCRAHATGTTNLGLSREDFLAFPAPEPTPAQRLIVDVLGLLDSKIEVNRRMNETLEAMARALFKSWFVDFDPVRAKSEGRPPTGMDAETANLFPSEMVGSDLGSIPRGWPVEKLGGVLELKRGYDLPAAQRKPGSIPIVSSSGPSGLHNEAKARAPGVVTGRYGTIGLVYYVRQDFWPLNTTLYVKDFKGVDALYAYNLLSLIDFQKFSDKGAVPGINRNHLHEELVVNPPLKLQQRFSSLAGQWLDLAARSAAETLILAETRDALLPRLLSGELSVAHAESAVQAIA